MPRSRSHRELPLLKALMKWFFHHLYHSLAWTYDLVANLVSLGRWFRWIELVIPFIQGPRVLELAHGTGHLQCQLGPSPGLVTFGLDESRQMSLLARRRTQAAGMVPPRLVRALAHHIPFATQSFQSIVTTFPAEFIFQPGPLQEIHRLLKVEGRLIVLPMAWIVGKDPLKQVAAWLFTFTRQVPPSPQEWLRARLERPLCAAGFTVEVNRLEVMQSIVLIVLATKKA